MEINSTIAELQSNATQSSQSLAENFDTFLTLLTAQLENQDPLEPVDSTEFTNQLVQFSGVEQQIQTNQAIADLISITTSSQVASLSGYLGRDVEIASPTADLDADSIEWRYNVPQTADELTLSVQDADGNIVYSETITDPEAGTQTFTWDGEVTNGPDVSSGRFTLLIGATNGSEETVTIDPRVRATVTGVDLSNGETALRTDAGTFGLSSVLRLAESGTL